MTLQIIHLREIPSTNSYAKKCVREGGMHGTVIWADNQTAGRGRLGKDWQSMKEKGLYCSIIYCPQCSREDYAKITLVVGLAVAEVLEEFIPTVPVMLKWPNDIYIAGKKCGGILCEAVLNDDQDVVVIGVGINVLHNQDDFTEEVEHRATSLQILGATVAVEELLQKVYTKVVERVDLFCHGGWPELLLLWKQRDFLCGKESEWFLGDGTVKYGRAEGVDEDGQLYMVTKDGMRHQVLSGDVQLHIKEST